VNQEIQVKEKKNDLKNRLIINFNLKMDIKVNKEFFLQTINKVIDFLIKKNVEKKIITEIKNLSNSFDLLTQEEQLNIWTNLHNVVLRLPDNILKDPTWSNIFLSQFKLN
jgi:hypothetical protein